MNQLKLRVCSHPDSRARATWSRRTWAQRTTDWLQTEPHDLEIGPDKRAHEVVYHVLGYQNGLEIPVRTLSQMADTRAEDYRRRCIEDATAALERL